MQKLAVKSEGSRGSFPTDSAGQQACVAEILAAIHNFEGIVDKAGKNGKAAQSHNRFEKGFYQQQEIELKAWQLLVSISISISRCRSTAYPPTKAYHWCRHCRMLWHIWPLTYNFRFNSTDIKPAPN